MRTYKTILKIAKKCDCLIRPLNIILVALLLLSTVYIGAVDAQIIYPDADVQVYNGVGYQDYNFGGQTDANAGRYSDVIWRLWFKTTLPVSGPMTHIASAKLYLYLKGGAYTGGLDSIGAYYASNDTWAENTITWNNAPNGSVSATPTSVITTQGTNWGSWYSWDITSAVNTESAGSVISIVLKQTDETVNGAQRNYYMSEYAVDPTLRPYIEILPSSLYAGATAVVSTRSGEGYTDIQSAIDSLPAGGGTVLIKEGSYTISTPIKVPSQVTLQGMGCNTTKIYTASAINGIEPKNKATETSTQYIKIMDLRVEGTQGGPWPTSTVGIDLYRTSNSVVENCIVANFQKGIWMRRGECWYNLVSNPWVYTCEDGIMIGDPAYPLEEANEQKIEYGRIWSCTRGVNFIWGNSVTVFGVAFESSAAMTGVKTAGYNMRIIGNRFELPIAGSIAVYVDTGAGDTDIFSNLLQATTNIVDKGKGTTKGDIVATGTMAEHVPSNLAKNGSFEDWVGLTPAYWTAYNGVTVAQGGEPGVEGTNSVSLTGAIGENYLGQTYTIPAYFRGNKTLSLSARVKMVTSQQCDVAIRDTADIAWRTIETLDADDGREWRTLYLTFPLKFNPPPPQQPTTQVEITLYPSGGEVLFDGVMMTSGDVPVGYEGPRFEPAILANKTINSSQTTIPHGLGRIPSFIDIKMKSNGQIWESAPADATNIYLQANQNGKICDVYVY